MTTVASTRHAELLAELRSLWARVPVPQPSWHPYVPLILAFRDGLGRAIDDAEARPAALDAFAALLEDGDEAELEPDAPAELAEAWARLHELPRPEGQHPYLDDIVPALDALRLLLVALGQTAA